MIKNLHEEYKLARNIYSAKNVLLSATHTHSGPAGYMQYALFQATSLGFINQTFNALVDGITKVSGFINMFYSYITYVKPYFSQFSWHIKTKNLPNFYMQKEIWMMLVSIEAQHHTKQIQNPKEKCKIPSKLIHGLFYIWTELLSIFFGDLKKFTSRSI